MKVELIEKSKKYNRISLAIEGFPVYYVNTIRRLIIDEVPTMAIEDIEFKKNNSVLYDEIIANRMGLIPLKTDLKSYVLPEKCKCKGAGCARCQLKMTLKVKATSNEKTVYSSDIKSKDPKVVPVYDKIPIVKLLKDQEIELLATAVLGKGKDHSKFSPGLAWYKYKPQIKVGKCKNPEQVVESCPKKIFDIKSGNLVIKKEKLNDCILCMACKDVCNSIEIEEDSTKTIFYFESWGQLTNKEVFNEATKIFDDKLNEFIKKIKK